MRRLRVTLAQLMAIILFVAFGFAALRNANIYWASASFNLAIISVSVATVGALARKGEARMSWAGFAIACGTCLFIRLLTTGTVGQLYGPPESLLYRFLAYINPSASRGGEFIAYVQICLSMEAILLGLIAAVLGHLVAVKDDRQNS